MKKILSILLVLNSRFVSAAVFTNRYLAFKQTGKQKTMLSSERAIPAVAQHTATQFGKIAFKRVIASLTSLKLLKDSAYASGALAFGYQSALYAYGVKDAELPVIK